MWNWPHRLDRLAWQAHLLHMLTVPTGRRIRQDEMAIRLGGFAATLLLIAVATIAGLLIAPRWGSGPVALLYIPPVLAAALLSGFWPAFAAAVLSALAYNFFFTAPYGTLIIHSPADIVTVTVLFLVAAVTSRLTASLREQSRRADAHATRNATIAGLARRLLSCADETAIADVAASELARLFGAHTALIMGGKTPTITAISPTGATLGPNDLAAAKLCIDSALVTGRGIGRMDLTDWQFHPVIAGEAVLAAAGLAHTDGSPPVDEQQRLLLANLLDQIALALERARLEREARDVAGLRERDRLRSALLTAIGEDVKPRLHAIAAAARAIRRAGGGIAPSLSATVATEAAQLDLYVDRLVDLNPGDTREPLVIGPLAIDLHNRVVRRDGTDVHLTPKEYAVLAELAKHAGRVLTHTHLLRAVWGPAQQEQIDYLRVAIRSLRLKLENEPQRPEFILNEPAVGYRLTAP